MAAFDHPRCFVPVLDRLRAEGPVHFGLDQVRLTPIAYEERPFSHILRVAVDGPQQLPAVFVKVFKSGGHSDAERMRRRVVEDFATMRRIHESMRQWRDLHAVRPIACYPELLASVTEQVAGEDLLSYLTTRAAGERGEHELAGLCQTLENVGRWLRAFQTIDAGVAFVPIESIREYIDVRLKRLVETPRARFTEPQRQAVLAHLDRLAAASDPADRREVIIHGDLAPANIMVDGRSVTGLDFPMTKRGSVLHDLTRLYFQVGMLALKPRFRRGVIQQLQQALLRGFDPELTPSRPMFRLLLILHRVNHLATLSIRREPLVGRIYNWHVRRHHRAWITRELQPAGATEAR